MSKPIKFDESGDSQDLQALFDTIAAGSPPVPPAREPDPSGDSDDLQALFDSVAEHVTETPAATTSSDSEVGDAATQEVVFNRIGHLVRKLHDSMRELGYDKSLEEAARSIPDAQERLHYIAKMTEQAAAKVLNACDIASPLQELMAQRVQLLGAQWEKMFTNQLSVDEFKQLAAASRMFFLEAPAQLATTKAQINEIMMSQDFQDLTGQVIKRVVEMVQNIEGQLLQVLIEVIPEDKKAAAPESLMNGPVINAAGRNDVLTNQAQVDDLLESLGF